MGNGFFILLTGKNENINKKWHKRFPANWQN
jgi:hypothetical protein